MEVNSENGYYSNIRFIQISKTFLYDVSRGSYDVQDLLVLSTIKMLASGTASPNSAETCVTTVDIILSMTKMCNNSRNKKSISESIARLIEGGLIGLYEDFSYSQRADNLKGILHLKIEEKIPSGEYFVKVHTEEYFNIVNSKERNTSKLFHVFTVICDTIYEKGSRVSCIKNDEIIKATGVDKKSVTKYIQELEKVKAIYRKMLTITDRDDGTVKSKNVYSRYGWRNYVEASHL